MNRREIFLFFVDPVVKIRSGKYRFFQDEHTTPSNTWDCATSQGNKTQPTKKKNSTQIELKSTVCVTRWWAGRDNANLAEQSLSQKMPIKRIKSRLSATCFVGRLLVFNGFIVVESIYYSRIEIAI